MERIPGIAPADHLGPGETESGPALGRGAFDRDRSSHRVDCFSDNRESHSAPLDLISRLECLKHLEDFLMKLRGNPRAVIRHFKFEFIANIAR